MFFHHVVLLVFQSYKNILLHRKTSGAYDQGDVYLGAVYILLTLGCWSLEVGQLCQAELFLDISPTVWTCNWGRSASKVGCLKQPLAKARCTTTDQQNLSPICNACQLLPKL